jgi:hypothetical protein
MMRSKYIYGSIIFIGIALLIILIVLLRSPNSESSFSLPAPLDPPELVAQVIVSEERQKMRTWLIEQVEKRFQNDRGVLQEEVNDADLHISSSDNEIQEYTEFVEKPKNGSVYSCNGGALSTEQYPNFDTISAQTAEGARVISHVSTVLGTTTTVTLLQSEEYPIIGNGPRCLDERLIGVSLDGTLLQSGVEYRVLSDRVDGLIGYARDGFGIYDAYAHGEKINEEELDVCHGHVSTVLWDGVQVSLYHYHTTDTFPYTVSCFMGQNIHEINI